MEKTNKNKKPFLSPNLNPGTKSNKYFHTIKKTEKRKENEVFKQYYVSLKTFMIFMTPTINQALKARFSAFRSFLKLVFIRLLMALNTLNVEEANFGGFVTMRQHLITANCFSHERVLLSNSCDNLVYCVRAV